MNFRAISALIVCASGFGLASAPAQAASTTFAQFFQAIPSEKVFNYTDLAGAPAASLTNGVSLITGTPFAILSAEYFGVVPVVTTLNLSAFAAAPATISGGTVTQAFSGTLSFTTLALANALTVQFTNAIFTAQNSSEAPTLTADDHLGSVISYSSDFADLSGLINKNFSLSFSSATTPLTYNLALQELPSARMSGVGTFAAAIPEPSTWAFMALGIGAVGMTLRSRKGRVAFS